MRDIEATLYVHVSGESLLVNSLTDISKGDKTNLKIHSYLIKTRSVEYYIKYYLILSKPLYFQPNLTNIRQNVFRISDKTIICIRFRHTV